MWYGQKTENLECYKCGEPLVRQTNYPNPTCFKCKTKERRANARKHYLDKKLST